MDFDIVDEELIADDALRLYRVLVWVEGKYVEEKTLKILAGVGQERRRARVVGR